jgi:subfamily B ATP-binding cassette protein MsbA
MFAISVLSMAVLAATEPAIPALLKPTIDGSFVDKDLSAITTMAMLLVLVFLIRGASGFAGAVTLTWVSSKVVMDLRSRMFDKLVTLPTHFYDHHASGSLISKVTFDASQVTEATTHVITVLVRDSLAVVGLLAWLLYLDWQLTMVALVAAPVVILVVKYFSKRLRRMSHHLQQSMGDLTHVVEEAIEGQKVVRSFGAQDYERRRFFDATNWARRFQVKFITSSAANAPIAQLVTAIALAVIVWLAANRSAQGEITVGGFVSFFTAMAMLFSPLKRLTGVNGNLQRGIAAATSVFSLIDEPSESDTGTREMGRAHGELAFRDVRFVYDGQEHPAVDGVDLRIEAGRTVALVGPSGSGKTTLANLIPRFYEPQAGVITLDGIDIRELTLASLRQNVALVSQDIVLFNDTVEGNIAYGPLAARGPEAVLAAAHAAHATEFIERLPSGMRTRIGNRGVRLSGGQRQRIAIARAFLKNAPVLILDEATSSLDTAAERHIQEAIEELRRGRTTVIIAHRLSSIERADRIVVMSEGKVLDTGTHTELLERSQLYAALYRFQFMRDEAREPIADAR